MARLVLLATIGVTIATSAPPHCSVEDEEPVSLLRTIPASGLTTQGAVHYRAPRGAWPVRMQADVVSMALPQPILDKEVLFDETCAWLSTSATPASFALIRTFGSALRSRLDPSSDWWEEA